MLLIVLLNLEAETLSHKGKVLNLEVEGFSLVVEGLSLLARVLNRLQEALSLVVGLFRYCTTRDWSLVIKGP